jgi:hypothetical protein
LNDNAKCLKAKESKIYSTLKATKWFALSQLFCKISISCVVVARYEMAMMFMKSKILKKSVFKV